MDKDDHGTLCRRHIGVLDARRLDHLDEVVHEDLTYGGRPMTRLDDRGLIADGIAAIPDLDVDIRLLAVEGDRIACRLTFDRTPQGEFLGLRPTGEAVSFSEQVFHTMRDRAIREVWSLTDRAATERQLAS